MGTYTAYSSCDLNWEEVNGKSKSFKEGMEINQKNERVEKITINMSEKVIRKQTINLLPKNTYDDYKSVYTYIHIYICIHHLYFK